MTQKVYEALELLPNKIQNFCLIKKSSLDIGTDKQSFVSYFKNVPKGSLEEIILAYDDYYTRHLLRVQGRGEELRLKVEHLQVFYDNGDSPVSAYPLFEKTIENWDFSVAVKTFLQIIANTYQRAKEA